MLVLGASGCGTSSPPPREPNDTTTLTKPPTDPPPGDDEQDPSPDPKPDATSTTTAVVATGDPPDANQLCAHHKATTTVKKPSATPRYASGAVAGDSAHWDRQHNVATCRIVRERTDVQMRVTRTPTCCPAGMPQGYKCPPPYETDVPGTRLIVEHAVLNADGSLVKQTVSSFDVEKHPEVHHNCGRRPEALELVGAAPGSGVGGELATMAELEAASVPAFDRLARELAAHGGPAELVRRAGMAMRDEGRHARAIGALAAQHGATPRSISVAELPLRPLEAIAIENAVEGCVREAYGALVATYQAEAAEPALRATFRAIARDERRHAALAEDVHAWIVGALAPASRAAVELARAAARAELRASLGTSPACEPLGVPGGAAAVALFDAYFA